MKIAYSSTDGKFVDIHFGKCSSWTIADFSNGKIKVLETRKTPRLCQAGGHTQELACDMFDLLSDCKIIVTVRMGIWIKHFAQQRGIKVIEYIGEIEKSLENAES
ncbi:MAG: hypothetical protein LBB93_04555 [Elusimicrobiota bacterium]|jgi:nitrogen fixation protein NifX|nr:hypothetical protein [Elusimicrobiota bacterium]